MFEAVKQFCLSEVSGGYIESLEDFSTRALAFKAKVKGYAADGNVTSDETVLIVTHSRMINCFLETMTWNADKRKYDWGIHTATSDIFKRKI